MRGGANNFSHFGFAKRGGGYVTFPGRVFPPPHVNNVHSLISGLSIATVLKELPQMSMSYQQVHIVIDRIFVDRYKTFYSET